jgi:sarcosine oxidase subunit beta
LAYENNEIMFPEKIPVISHSQTNNYGYHAFGFSAHGFQLSPVIGKVMSEIYTPKINSP